MLQYFFENSEQDNSYLFKDLNIMKAGEKYTSHMGKYPVINLSLKSAKQPTFELAYISIRRRIAEEYKRHDYILDFESALKTNSSLEFSVITGCLRISRESIFTGLNNLDIISIK